MSVNKVILIGNVCKEPATHTFNDGNKSSSLLVATSTKWKDSKGEYQTKTEFNRIKIENQSIISVVEKWVKTGTKVYVEGTLRTSKWTDRQGRENASTEVVIPRYGNGQLITLSREANNEDEPRQVPVPNYKVDYDKNMNSRALDILDDEVPF